MGCQHRLNSNWTSCHYLILLNLINIVRKSANFDSVNSHVLIISSFAQWRATSWPLEKVFLEVLGPLSMIAIVRAHTAILWGDAGCLVVVACFIGNSSNNSDVVPPRLPRPHIAHRPWKVLILPARSVDLANEIYLRSSRSSGHITPDTWL